MSTSYPTSKQTFTNPTSSDQLSSPSHAGQHADVNDTVEALEDSLIGGEAATTFTPTITGGGSATFTNRAGRYLRIGKLVFIWMTFEIVAAGSGSSAVEVTGGPNHAASASGQSLFGRRDAGASPNAVAILFHFGTTDNNWDRIRFGDGTNLLGSALLAGDKFWFSGCFEAA